MAWFQKNKIVILEIVITLFIVIILAVYFMIAINTYMATHTWATLGILEEVHDETSDVYMYDQEFLKGDILYLHGTTVLIEDISHDGTVKLSFQPAVVNSEDRETVSTVILNYEECFNFIENCVDGEAAFGQLQVIEHRYQ